MIDDLCVLVCTYKRPYLIEGLLKSWMKTNCNTTNNIAIAENSPEDDVSMYLDSVGVSHARSAGRSHPDGLTYGMQHITQRYVLIVDSDVLFYGSVADDILGFISSGCTIGGEYCYTRGGYDSPTYPSLVLPS